MSAVTKNSPFVERSPVIYDFFRQGDEAMAAGEFERAHTLYTEGHDLTLDSAALHALAHEKLLPCNRARGDWGEAATDWLLLRCEPLGVFKLVAWFTRNESRLSAAYRGA